MKILLPTLLLAYLPVSPVSTQVISLRSVNEIDRQLRQASSCALETNVDYVGYDIGDIPAIDASRCCDICINTQNCGAFSWNNFNGGTCWLKSRKDQVVLRVGVVSAIVIQVPCTFESEVDYVGNDIGSVVNSDPVQCCSICRGYSNCRAFSWSNYQGGTCWLKSAMTATAYSPGIKSGIV